MDESFNYGSKQDDTLTFAFQVAMQNPQNMTKELKRMLLKKIRKHEREKHTMRDLLGQHETELEARQDLIDKMKKEIESLNKDKAALNFKI